MEKNKLLKVRHLQVEFTTDQGTVYAVRDIRFSLEPGESKTITLEVPADDLAFVGYDNHWRLEEGDFRITVGSEHVMVRCTQTHIWKTPNQ